MLTQLSILAALLPLADAKTDAEKIQGTWEVVKILTTNKFSENRLKDSKLVIDGSKIRFVRGKQAEFPKAYKLGSTQTPKTLDMGTFPQSSGIYALEGDELKICLPSRSKTRPTAFPDKPTEGVLLLVLKRGKPIPANEIIDKNRTPDTVRVVLDKAEQLELLSLDPNDRKGAPNTFHGYKVLGSTVIKDKGTRKKLLQAFYEGVAESEGVAAACFIPRHGIRAVHGDKKVDLVICFQCLALQIYGPEKQGSLLITESPRETFNKLLRDARVPLPEK